MNPALLPAIGRALRNLAEFARRAEVNDVTLTDLAGELERALSLVKTAQGHAPAGHHCTRHPGGPVDPTAENGCLLCGPQLRRPARPMPDDVELGDVLRAVADLGHDAATARYGAIAVARAVAIGARHPAGRRPPNPPPGHEARPHTPEGDPA